jgi:hypothetical protein
MLHNLIRMLVMTALGLVISIVPALSQNITQDYGDDEYQDADRARIDRYLDVEIWTNHSDGEYYEGDNIVISYRANRDAFVAVYSIDSRGRVSLLFPSEPGRDNFIRGGVTYRMPDGLDDFDLVVSGPEGVENIQIIASRERFPIPDWYPTSGLMCDWDDRYEYMDYLNDRYFVRYGGQRFAYDRTAIFVNEWEPYYFRPVYYPVYHNWTVCGNMYIDYPIGATVYIDGFYWGCAPLYIPRIYVGWHTITVYDYYGYCWESDFHVTRYHTAVLGHKVIRTSPTVVSKFKEVRYSGYRNPEVNGYPDFNQKHKAIMKSASVKLEGDVTGDASLSKETRTIFSGEKKHVRGSAELVKTERGYETTGSVYGVSKKAKQTQSESSKIIRSGKTTGSKSTSSSDFSKKSSTVGGQAKSSSDKKGYQESKPKVGSEKSSGYYQKKSGSTYKKKSNIIKSTKVKSPTSTTSKGIKSSGKSGSSKKSGSSYKSPTSSKPSGKATSPSVGKSGSKAGSTTGKKSSSQGKGKR